MLVGIFSVTSVSRTTEHTLLRGYVKEAGDRQRQLAGGVGRASPSPPSVYDRLLTGHAKADRSLSTLCGDQEFRLARGRVFQRRKL